MKILLDTHILVWFHSKDSELSERTWKIILDSENEIYYSSVNIWETQIKHLLIPKPRLKLTKTHLIEF